MQIAEAILAEPEPCLDRARFSEEACEAVSKCLKHGLKERVALTDLIQSSFVANGPSRQEGLLPLVEQVLSRKRAQAEEEEIARRRALVGGGKARAPSPAN